MAANNVVHMVERVIVLAIFAATAAIVCLGLWLIFKFLQDSIRFDADSGICKRIRLCFGVREALPNHFASMGAFIEWLEGYERWYGRASKRAYGLVDYCKVTPLMLSFSVAVVSAMPDDQFENKNVLIIIITGFSALMVSLIDTLKLLELAAGREDGRITCAELVAKAKVAEANGAIVSESASDAKGNKNDADIIASILAKTFKLEREQAAMYRNIRSGPSKVSGVGGEQRPNKDDANN